MKRVLPKVPSDGYLPRIADVELSERLARSGAVQIKGPKWCGKTATAERQAKSAVYMQDPDRSASLIFLAETKPSAILEGPEPRLVDEWQEAPQIWDAVRYAVDRSRGKGRFILTGSATPSVKPKHSGVGRIARMTMLPMSLYESQESLGTISLRRLFDGTEASAELTDFDIEDLAFSICRGGWPEAVLEPDSTAALLMAKDYIDELLDTDIERIDETRRNATWMRSIMRSYARNVSTEAPITTIAADMGGEAPSIPTVTEYIDALARAYVFDDIPAWTPRLRSKTAVRTSPTRHFADPSLAAALLGATPANLLQDFQTFGLLFESLCVRDLKVYAGALHGRIYHYRDKTDLEADAVVVLDDGRWGLVEVKLGASQIESASRKLKKLADRICHESEGAPSFLMVLTGSNAAYRREDGVYVVPLALLGP